jgi:hypothetical protein
VASEFCLKRLYIISRLSKHHNNRRVIALQLHHLTHFDLRVRVGVDNSLAPRDDNIEVRRDLPSHWLYRYTIQLRTGSANNNRTESAGYSSIDPTIKFTKPKEFSCSKYWIAPDEQTTRVHRFQMQPSNILPYRADIIPHSIPVHFRYTTIDGESLDRVGPTTCSMPPKCYPPRRGPGARPPFLAPLSNRFAFLVGMDSDAQQSSHSRNEETLLRFPI